MFRHRFDPSSLLVGILFLGIAVRYLAGGSSRHPAAFIWSIPALLTTVVVIVLLRLVFRSRRRDP